MVRDHRTKLRVGLSLAAIAAGFLGGLGAAHAQDAPQSANTPQANTPQSSDTASSADDETIVVTGYRASLGRAIDIKRDENSAVDAIVADDIASFPDLNLSESIQRIPGVAITRSQGEGRNISVRGLGPQFTRVRLNGMEAMSAEGSTDAEGGTNRSRSFDFNLFASELFNNITVRKTASADVEEGSLGATVDLRTARPFDYPGFTLASSYESGYNDLSANNSPRFAFLISDRFFDNRVGALFSLAYSDTDGLEEGASTVRWQNDGTNPSLVPVAGCLTTNGCAANSRFQTVLGVNSGATYDAVNEAFHPRIPRYDIYNETSQRFGATLALQYRPDDDTDITLDALYALHKSTRSESFLEAPVFSTTGASAIGAVDVTGFQVDGNTLTFGQFNDVDIRSEYRYDQLSTQLQQVSLTLQRHFGDRMTLDAFAGHSTAQHSNPIQTTLLWDHADVDGYSYDYRGNNRLPLITYGGLAVDDPAVWTLSQIRLRPQYVTNQFETVYGSLTFEANPWLSLQGGVNWKDYNFNSRELRRSNGTTANLETVIPGFAASTPTSSYAQIVSLNGTGLDIPPGLIATYAAPNVTTAAALWNLYDTSVFTMGIQPALGNNFSVEEEDRGAYVQADWDTNIASMRFRGNVGVRYVETDQTATGYTFSSGSPLLQTVTRTYDDTLPSLNMVLEPGADLVLRFAAAKVLTRPNLGQLNPGAAVSVSGSNRTVTAGNPDLDPFRANSYDLALEWYFHDDALLSVAYFHKDIDSFVQTVREVAPFTGNSLGLPDSVAIAACGATPSCSPADLWQFSIPQNTPGGPLDGYEVSLQLPFYFLPGWLANFGTLLNYTHVESSIDYVNSAGAVVVTDSLTGLSAESWNATLYYEDDHLSARISAAYRSDYLTTIPGRNLNLSESTASTLNVDFSSSYAFNDHLKLTLEGLNLTDEVSDQFLSPDDRSSFYHHYGRTLLLGLRYNY